MVVTVVKKLYELQQLDTEIQKEQEALEQVERQLGESDALVKARSSLVAEKEYLAEISKQQRDAEREIEEIRTKISQMSSKLYGGTVKNPKELMGIEQDVALLKANLRQKEDTLLDIMDDVESTQKRIKGATEQFQVLEEDWRKGQESLSVRQTVIKRCLADLERNRKELTSDIPVDSLELYQMTRVRRGQAVVKIEQGRCQGCRITLSTNELQRARAGNLILCSTCSRILYLG